jgi:hypothetical protein
MKRTVYPTTKAIPKGPIKPEPGPFFPFSSLFVAMHFSLYQEVKNKLRALYSPCCISRPPGIVLPGIDVNSTAACGREV